MRNSLTSCCSIVPGRCQRGEACHSKPLVSSIDIGLSPADALIPPYTCLVWAMDLVLSLATGQDTYIRMVSGRHLFCDLEAYRKKP